MRVGFDLTCVSDLSTGVQRVAYESCRALVREEPGIDWIVLAPAHIEAALRRSGIQILPCTQRCDRCGILWQQLGLPRVLRQLECDLLISPSYTAPLAAPCPILLFVHDVIALDDQTSRRARTSLTFACSSAPRCGEHGESWFRRERLRPR